MRLTTFRLAALTLLVSCELEDPKIGVNERDILAWSLIQPVSIEANGISKGEISVILGEGIDANQEVTFTTDQGFFEGAAGSLNPKEFKIKSTGKGAKVILI